MLVAQGGRDGGALQVAGGLTVDLRGRTDLRQQVLRDAQGLQDLRVPLQAFQVHQHGAAGVGDVGDVPAGQLPDDPGVHGPEQQFTAVGSFADPVDVVQEPADLGAGEVGGQRQAALGTEPVLALVTTEFAHEVVGAGVLPDDGVVDRLSGLLVPQQGGLALVGDADGGDLVGGDVAFLQGFPHDGLDVGPDLLGVVFHPARFGEDLTVLTLVYRDDAPVPVEEDAAARRGALVDRGDVLLTHRSRLQVTCLGTGVETCDGAVIIARRTALPHG